MPEESTSRELFPLSIVILTKNEEDHLQDCLESCQWAEDILPEAVIGRSRLRDPSGLM